MHNGQCTMAERQPRNTQHATRNIWLTFALVFTLAWVGVNHAFAFVDPDPAHPAWFQRVRVADLAELVPAQQVRQISGGEGGEAETAIFVADGDKVSLGLALPDEPLFLWVQPQAVGEVDVRFELRMIPGQGDPLVWQGTAPERMCACPWMACRAKPSPSSWGRRAGTGCGSRRGSWPGRPIRGRGDGGRDNLPGMGQDFYGYGEICWPIPGRCAEPRLMVHYAGSCASSCATK